MELRCPPYMNPIDFIEECYQTHNISKTIFFLPDRDIHAYATILDALGHSVSYMVREKDNIRSSILSFINARTRLLLLSPSDWQRIPQNIRGIIGKGVDTVIWGTDVRCIHFTPQKEIIL